jgi:hypothetical protein
MQIIESQKRSMSVVKADFVQTSGDIALNTASIFLAVFAASFAWYMITYGPGDSNGSVPKATLALRPFAAPDVKLGTYDNIDPIVTGSITQSPPDGLRHNRRAFDLAQGNLHLQFNLRAVFQNTAYVDVTNGKALVTVAVIKGDELPGIGNVLRLEKRQGRWIVVTTLAEITEEGMLSLTSKLK